MPREESIKFSFVSFNAPYIAFTALGLVIYSRFKANSKKQEGVGEDKAKKGETGVPKRLAYGVLAAVAILVIPIPITRETDGQQWKKSHNEVSKIVEV